jgi:signal transduction histidine kinase
VAAGPGRVLTLRGRVLPAADQKVLAALAAQAGELVETERLRRAAAEADELAEGNRVRTALLAGVSHDLRTPLAGIKSASSGLRQDAVHLSEADRAELLATIEDSADRLDRLVANLLDLSRLQTGAVGSSGGGSCCRRPGARRTGPRPTTCGLYMAQLRRKLKDDPSQPRHLITEAGMGYRFEP